MAEKPKKQSNTRLTFKKALSLVLLGFFAFLPVVSSAAGCKQESGYQQCDIDAISINMDTFTGGASPDNYARVGADGTLSMTAKVTLATPVSFTIGTDKVNTNTWGSNTISKFAIGLVPVSEASAKCQQDSTASIGAATTFINCNFGSFKRYGPSSGKVNAGEVLVNGSFSISGSQFGSLGMTAPTAGFTRFKLYIYPAMYYGAVVDTQIAYAKSGKEMTVDLYAKQTDATAANASGRPADVAGYGSTTGSAPNGEEGGPLWGIISKIVGLILGIIQEIIYAIFYFLLVPIIQAMLSIRVYTDTFVSVIYPGWIVLRNLCNIIFIVAIMAIAMGMLLRVEAYKSRSVLVQLILAALLVNFSLVVGQIVLGIADTVQSQFLPNNQEVIRALGKDLMVSYRSEVFNLKLGGYFSDIVKQFMFLILACGSFAVFAAIAAFLFIRMVMLWILLMISPLAYAAGALPSTAHYRKEWWTTFLKYAFFTPIMAFFLNMTAIISDTYKTNTIFSSFGVKDADFGGSSLAGFVFRVGSTVLLIVFLLVALKVAESFSIFGAGEISKFAKKGMFAPAGLAGWGAKRGVGYLGRWYNEATSHLVEQHGDHPVSKKRKALFAALNPLAFAKGWEKRAQELKHAASSLAEARGREVAEQLLTGGKIRIPYGQFAERADENNLVKDYETMRKEQLMFAAVEAEKMKGLEGSLRRRAILKAAAKQGYLDDVRRMAHFAIQYADLDGSIDSVSAAHRFFMGYLGENEQTYRFLGEDMEPLGKENGHYEYVGQYIFDPKGKTWKSGLKKVGPPQTITRNGKTIQFDELVDDGQALYAAGEHNKTGGRQRVGVAPHNLWAQRVPVAKFGGDLLNKKGDPLEDTDEIEYIKWGRVDGSSDEFQTMMKSQLSDAASMRDFHFTQGRVKGIGLSYEVDKIEGIAVVEDEDDYNRILADYKNHPQMIAGLYNQQTGVPVNEVKGFKVAWFDKTTKKREIREVGDAGGMPLLMVKDLVTEVLEDPNSSLGKTTAQQKDEIKKELQDIYSQMYHGQINEADIRAKIDSTVGKITTVNATKVGDTVLKIYHDNIEERFSPSGSLDRVSDIMKSKFTFRQKKALTDGLSKAIATVYLNAAKKATDLIANPGIIESEIKTVIQTLSTSTDPSIKITDFSSNAEAIRLLVEYATPTK